jgi:alpha-glucosidase
MQWEAGRSGGFSAGEPWLAPVDPGRRNVAAQRADPGSLLWLYRRLIAVRRELAGGLAILDAPPGVLAFARGAHAIAINFTGAPASAPVKGELVLSTEPGAPSPGRLRAGEGVIVRSGNV